MLVYSEVKRPSPIRAQIGLIQGVRESKMMVVTREERSSLYLTLGLRA